MFSSYQRDGFFDEMIGGQDVLSPHYRQFRELFDTLTPEEFDHKRHAVDLAFLRQGVTFNVYGDSRGAERVFLSI